MRRNTLEKIFLVGILLFLAACRENNTTEIYEVEEQRRLRAGGPISTIYLFQSSNQFQGTIGNRASMDAECQTSWATHSGHGKGSAGRSYALISFSEDDEIRDAPARFGFSSLSNVMGIAGLNVADSWEDFLNPNVGLTNSLSSAPEISQDFWTGSTSTGALASTCNQWTSSAGTVFGNYSDFTNSGNWISRSNNCSSTNRILCMSF